MSSRWSFLFCLALNLLAALASGQAAPELRRELPYVPPKRWAMVIGAGEYLSFGKLNFAVKDAESFSETLIEQYQFQPGTVELITDSPKSQLKPTAETIKAALAKQISDKRLDKADLFIFYFSGHGLGTAKGDLLLPTDATNETAAEKGQPIREIIEMFVQAGLRNVLVIVDACRAGEKNSFGKELRELGKKANIAVMLGCAPGARSYEYPRLGHGAFTNFLLKSLKDRELCSPVSGALWASKVAEDVSKRVYEYTERDYHENAQRPISWTEKTEDVLLGSFVSRSKLADAASAFILEAKKLDPEDYAASLDQYGCQLSNDRAFPAAIEVFKTLDGLGKLSANTRYLAGFCLRELGRNVESQREFERLAKQDENPLVKYLSIVCNPGRTISPSARAEAARMAWKLEPSEPIGMVLWHSLMMDGSVDDSLRFLEGVLASKVLSPRNQRFLEGQQAGYTGNWKVARQRFEEALAIEGNEPSDSLLQVSRYSALTQLGLRDEMIACLKKVAEDEEHAVKAILALADLYKEEKDEEKMVAAVKEALRHKLQPSDLLEALRTIGIRVGDISDQLGVRAAEFPFSWQAAVARSWSKGKGLAGGIDPEAFKEAAKYSDDEFEVTYEYLRILDVQLDEFFEKGVLKEKDYLQQQLIFSAYLSENIDKFGFDFFAWMLLSKSALASEKNQELMALFEAKLGKFLSDGTLDPKLRAPFLLAAINSGDTARMEQLWKLGINRAGDVVDGGWYRAIALALSGDIAEARTGVPNQMPSHPLDVSAKALLAYLDAAEGKAVDLGKVRATVAGDYSATQLIALAYAKQGDWATAESILKDTWYARMPRLSNVQAKATEVYFERLIATRQFKEANDVAYKIMTSAFGNPLYSRIHFGATPEVASFAGEVKLEGVAFHTVADLKPASVQLKVTKEGVVSLAGNLSGAVWEGTGSVDTFGNLKVAVKSGGQSWALTGKIAQPGLYKSMPEFGQVGQGFLMLEPNGQSIYFFGQTPK